MKTTDILHLAKADSSHALAKRCAIGRVVLIDDDPEILEALQTLLRLEGYACEAYNSALGYLQTLESRPADSDVPCCVLCDVKMPEMSGLDLQCRLAAHGSTPFLLMSGVSGASEVANGFRAGALDFLIKPLDVDGLLKAIASAIEVSQEQQEVQLRKNARVLQLSTVTFREREVVRLVAQGRTNNAIAEELGIALRTVKLHRHRALKKLGINNMVELIRLADESGW